MTAVELPTCKASPHRTAHHERQWRILEGLSLFDGAPLAVGAGDAWDVIALRSYGLVQLGRSQGGVEVALLTQAGRSLLDAREAERAAILREDDALGRSA